ncbi:MAG: hypothetical protein HQL25_03980 [Candidatus Omnitrophica bacterium]|nr:hypothetical protein [Candidatus Omnitrophota bacterium]
MAKNYGKTSLGIDPKIAAVLSYSLGWVTGIVLYLLENDNKYVRFHAIQSVIVFGILNFLVYLPFFGVLLGMAGFVLWLVLMVKAYQGEYFKLPVAGEWAEKYK